MDSALNRPFKEWNEVFPNATCIATLLDRLLHHADVTAIEGDSYRMRESEQETAARRRLSHTLGSTSRPAWNGRPVIPVQFPARRAAPPGATPTGTQG
jgi:hypothetical protein